VLDVLMPEVVLRAGVLAVIGQFETAGMAEHMRVHVNCIFAAFPSLVIILRKPAASWALRARSRTRSAQALARAGGAVRRGVRCRSRGGPKVCHSWCGRRAAEHGRDRWFGRSWARRPRRWWLSSSLTRPRPAGSVLA
jgi:hypothetical protein